MERKNAKISRNRGIKVQSFFLCLFLNVFFFCNTRGQKENYQSLEHSAPHLENFFFFSFQIVLQCYPLMCCINTHKERL